MVGYGLKQVIYVRALYQEERSQRILMGQFQRMQVILPPLEEQKEIVLKIKSLFKVADLIQQQYQQTKGATDQLDQSILAEAFRGALVPQDPNDEPASVLLERIRTEREKSIGATPKRSKKSKSASEPIQMKLELE
jgi:hypothetical protein